MYLILYVLFVTITKYDVSAFSIDKSNKIFGKRCNFADKLMLIK